MSRRFLELRRTARLSVNAPGKVINISAGLRIAKVCSCRVIDVSSTGAQLEIFGDDYNDSFYLELDSEPNNLTTCLVVRRAGNKVGVKFL